MIHYPMLKAVVFDLNGVVWKSRKFNSLSYDLLSNTLKLHPKTIRLRYKKFANRFQLGKLDFYTWLQSEFRLSQDQSDDIKYKLEQLFKSLYQSSFYPDSLPLIRSLQKKGITVGCLSNMPNFIADLFTKAGLFCSFDFKILSSSVGFQKPNQKIFKKIFSIGRWKPQEVLIIDNQINNINVAKKMGFATHYFKSYSALISKLGF